MAAAQPWLWFAAGVASFYGYQNMFPALLVLLCGWICWLKRHDHTIAALSGLVLATWGAAVAWGPLAVIPASWLLAAAVATLRVADAEVASGDSLRTLLRRDGLRLEGDVRRRHGWNWKPRSRRGRADRQLSVDLRARGTARGGGHPRLALDLIRRQVGGPGRRTTHGLGDVRPDPPTRRDAGWWGYYPTKYSLLVACLIVILAPAALQVPARALARRGWRGMGVGVALVILTVGMVKSVPPTPMAIEPHVGTPMQWRADQTYDAPTARMLSALDENPKTLFAGFFPAFGGWLSGDYTLSFWTMEIASKDLSDELRFAAYAYNPADGATVCATVQAFGDGTVVYTRDPVIARELPQRQGMQPGRRLHGRTAQAATHPLISGG